MINEIVKRHMRMLDEEKMIRAYQQMSQPEAMAEFFEWERATLGDGLMLDTPSEEPDVDMADPKW